MHPNSKIIGRGTLAWPVNLTSKRPATIKPKPNELQNKRRCAVVLELVWHQKSNIPIKIQPTPIFFLRAIPTLIACSFSEMLGNIATVKSSGKNQNTTPKSTIITPLNASASLEFLILAIHQAKCTNFTGSFRTYSNFFGFAKLALYCASNWCQNWVIR